MKKYLLCALIATSSFSTMAEIDPFSYLDFQAVMSDADRHDTEFTGKIELSQSFGEHFYGGFQVSGNDSLDIATYGATLGFQQQVYDGKNNNQYLFAEYTWLDTKIEEQEFSEDKLDFNSSTYKLGLASTYENLSTKVYVGYQDVYTDVIENNWVMGAEVYYQVSEKVSFGINMQTDGEFDMGQVGLGLRVRF
jgi:hypothetical protein